jgi:aspartate aminotransferase
MIISSRVKTITESVTLKLNARAVELAESGKKVYNLTAGQLPFKPYSGLVEKIKEETES